MNTCSGKFYDGQSTRSYDAVLMWDQDGTVLILRLTAANREVQFDRSAVSIDIPLGSSSPRMLEFEDGARFYANDDQSLEALCRKEKKSARNPHALASRLERHKHAILLSVILLITFLVVGYRYGVPAVADSLAFKLPVSTLEKISNRTLDSLDRFMGFHPTTLEETTLERYQSMFSNLVSEIGSDIYDYRLEFRSFGINAFALPSGVIIMGDELIGVMPNDEAVLAVLAHELAHVEGRHGTRQILRDAGIAFLIGSAFGDLGAGAGVFASLPKMLMTSGYSRQFETDADLFSADYMTDRYGSPEGMIEALETLGECTEGLESESLKWISSHPMTQERIEEVRDHQTP